MNCNENQSTTETMRTINDNQRQSTTINDNQEQSTTIKNDETIYHHVVIAIHCCQLLFMSPITALQPCQARPRHSPLATRP
jgi:hypothetical protein